MRKSRQVLAIALVTAALCADRAAVAAPAAITAPVARMAVNLGNRLTSRLSAGVAATIFLQRFGIGGPQICQRPTNDQTAIDIRPVQLSPFQFRLPPPVL